MRKKKYAVPAILVRGYLTKESADTKLMDAIRTVASGRPYISSAVAEQLAMDAMPSGNSAAQTTVESRV